MVLMIFSKIITLRLVIPLWTRTRQTSWVKHVKSNFKVLYSYLIPLPAVEHDTSLYFQYTFLIIWMQIVRDPGERAERRGTYYAFSTSDGNGSCSSFDMLEAIGPWSFIFIVIGSWDPLPIPTCFNKISLMYSSIWLILSKLAYFNESDCSDEFATEGRQMIYFNLYVV